ncbi:MAG: LptA/OstA family protein [Bdellovibrionota bacterium]|jgi:lipopolysaccharide transport protein LptA
MKTPFILILIITLITSTTALAETSSPLDSLSKQDQMEFDVGNSPTYIKSTSLILKANERVFIYSGAVDVLHGDLHMTCDELEGYYNENNQITKMIAKKNVTIVKGTSIRATCQKTIYEQSSESLTLTENPELLQDGSVLSADSIVIHLQTNKSEATGNVRVKLVKQGSKDKK